MKLLMTVLLALSSTQSFASWYQMSCSDAKSILFFENGHDANNVIVTSSSETPDGTTLERKIKLNSDEVIVDYDSGIEISTKSSVECDPGATTGIATWQTISAKYLKIANVNGSHFSDDILGTSNDRSSIVSHVICEENGSGLTECPE